VATSQPLATLSGLDLLREGGNAVDAAICAAAVLCVTEPGATGVGGDLLAIVHDPEGRLHGLDAAGPAPHLAPPDPPAIYGPRSVNVPGAVAGWGELARRFGRVGLERCLRPAATLAESGVVSGFNASRTWRTSPQAPAALRPPPDFGRRYRLPDLAATLRGIAAGGPEFLYAGPAAAAMRAGALPYGPTRPLAPPRPAPHVGDMSRRRHQVGEMLGEVREVLA
jgi:gamma-glutamyltranspeptidase / glutathione hydrolase